MWTFPSVPSSTWNPRGSVGVGSSASSTTKVIEVSGGAAVPGLYLWNASGGGATHYAVVFPVHPTTCPIALNGTSQPSGSSGNFPAGTYSLQANP